MNTSLTGVDGLATKSNVRNAISEIVDHSTGYHQVFIFFSTHGGGYNSLDNFIENGGYDQGGDEEDEVRESTVGEDINGDGQVTDDWVGIDEVIEFNNWTELYWDDELANDLSSITCQTMIVVIEACYSGGFIDDLSAYNRIILTATNETYYAHANGDNFGYWVQEFLNALNGEVCVWDNGLVHTGQKVDADYDNNGCVSIGEAQKYALEHDVAAYLGWECPWLDDNGNKRPSYYLEGDHLDEKDRYLAKMTYINYCHPYQNDC